MDSWAVRGQDTATDAAVATSRARRSDGAADRGVARVQCAPRAIQTIERREGEAGREGDVEIPAAWRPVCIAS